MSPRKNLRAAVDDARLTTKLSVIGTLVAGFLLLLTFFMGVSNRDFIGLDIYALAVVPYSLALVFALAAMFYGMLGTTAAQEEEEKAFLEKRDAARALSVEEDVRFTAGRTFENYKRFAPYVLAVLGVLIIAAELWGFSVSWSSRVLDAKRKIGSHATIIAAVMTFVSVFTGAFFVGQSRQKAFRWLRSFGAWLLGGFGVMFVAMIASIFASNGITWVDPTCAKVVFWILAVLGAEFVISFIIEFYRPRTLREERPIFESKLLALFTEPGGVMRNIAAALDYQFGFKVSGTWLYGFLEKSFFPVVLFWAVMLWGFSAIHEVGPNEVGVKVQLGVVTSEQPLHPGIYWTLPWPFGEVRRFSCTEIRQVVIGEPEGRDSGSTSQITLWTGNHETDANFIVAVAPEGRGKTAAAGEEDKSPVSREAAPISFVRARILIQYHIREDQVMDYAFKNLDPVITLWHIGEQASTEYLASCSIMELMSVDRSKIQGELLKRVQSLADSHELGVDIVAVLLLDSHPPIEVAGSYQNVIGSMEEKESIILRAESYSAQTIPMAEANAHRIVSEADSYRFKMTTVAKAEAGRFNTQLTAYQAMPQIFRLKAYLNFLENDCRDVRKFIVASGLKDEVYELNFEEKERFDLIDADLSELGSK